MVMTESRHCGRVLLALGLLATVAAGAVPDPTRPPSAREAASWRGAGQSESPDWRLESVLISDQRRVAVINGQSVSVGDRVDGAEVVTIEPGRVRLRTDSRQVDLSLRRQVNQSRTRQDAAR